MTIDKKINDILTESTIVALSEKIDSIIIMAENSKTGNEEIFVETLSIMMENAYNTINQTRVMNGKKPLSEDRFYETMQSILERRGENRFKDAEGGTSGDFSAGHAAALTPKQSPEGQAINRHMAAAAAAKTPRAPRIPKQNMLQKAGSAVSNKWNSMGTLKKGAVIAGAAGLGMYAMKRIKVRKCRQNCMTMGDDAQKNLCLKRCGA